jgi:hypothetical protein
MKVAKSTIEKLTITGVERLDTIAVMSEDFGPGQGKITITCFNECWSNYWGAMGKENIKQFFSTCDNSYLIGKLAPAMKSTIRNDDQDDWTTHLRAEIIKRRREDRLDKDDARRLYDEAEYPDNDYGEPESGLFFEVFGDEWWHCLPEQRNPQYDHLCRIIDTVKAAFKEELK